MKNGKKEGEKLIFTFFCSWTENWSLSSTRSEIVKATRPLPRPNRVRRRVCVVVASKCPFSHVLLLWSNSLTREEAQWYKNLTFVAFSKSRYWVLYQCASRKESPSFGLQHQQSCMEMQWRSWLRPCVTLSKIAAWGRLLSIKNETFCLSEHSVWK